LSHIQIDGYFTENSKLELSSVTYNTIKTDEVIEKKGINVSIPFQIPKKIGDIQLK